MRHLAFETCLLRLGCFSIRKYLRELEAEAAAIRIHLYISVRAEFHLVTFVTITRIDIPDTIYVLYILQSTISTQFTINV